LKRKDSGRANAARVGHLSDRTAAGMIPREVKAGERTCLSSRFGTALELTDLSHGRTSILGYRTWEKMCRNGRWLSLQTKGKKQHLLRSYG
jgi:hypothetical protein